MGKLEMFMIVFDNQIATYYAGQTVSGRVKVKLKEPMQMRGIYMKLEGKTFVHWSEKEKAREGRSNDQSKNARRSATEIYFDFKQCLWGKGVKETLAPGYYEFPFSMLLPGNLPTSFESTYGHVRYHCQANIDRPWKFDPKCKAAFTVLSIVDLNLIPDSSKSMRKENSKRIGCCCCVSGSITATALINKMGFVSGENILITASIENQSSRVMNKTSATLMTVCNSV